MFYSNMVSISASVDTVGLRFDYECPLTKNQTNAGDVRIDMAGAVKLYAQLGEAIKACGNYVPH